MKLNPVACQKLLCWLLLLSGGCQQQEDTAAPLNKTSQAAASTLSTKNLPTKEEAGLSQSKQQPQLPVGVRIDQKGNRWLDDIPYDIWFEKPLALVQPVDLQAAGPNVASSGNARPVAPAGQPVTTTGKRVAAEASDSWTKLVSAEVLESEVTSLSIQLGKELSQLGVFNKSLDELGEQSATLTAIGLVAARHPGEIRWKKQALVLADCGSRLEKQSESKGRAAFRAAQIPLEQIRSILNGETVSTEHEIDSENSFSKRVARGPLMYRMERAYNWLDENVHSQATLKQHHSQAGHEAALLAMTGKIITDPGYPSAEEEGYHQEAVGFTAASVALAAAVRDENYETFRSVLDRIENHCSNCHADWRFGE